VSAPSTSLSNPSLLRAWRSSDLSGASRPIRLNMNENAYGPSAKAIQAIRESIDLANRYPSVEYTPLAEAIAALHRVKVEQVALGCGSSEILRIAAVTFLGPEKKLILASPTYDLIAHEARRLHAKVVAVPLTKLYAHDLDAMLAHADASAGLVYICNPNNPSGSLTARQDLETFIRKLPSGFIVVIDEAYHHYVAESSSYASFIDNPVDDDRLIVTRTFSAAYGLAGLRVGYAVATPKRARQLSSGRLQFGVNTVAAKAAVAALNDGEYLRMNAKRNADDRQEFLNRANGWMLRTIDSHTNFLLVNTGRPVPEVIEHFERNNILLGTRIPSMDRYVRVSLGTPSEMERFWHVWDLMPPREMSM
jgi:histidinol-phosphate aminotransferase